MLDLWSRKEPLSLSLYFRGLSVGPDLLRKRLEIHPHLTVLDEGRNVVTDDILLLKV